MLNCVVGSAHKSLSIQKYKWFNFIRGTKKRLDDFPSSQQKFLKQHSFLFPAWGIISLTWPISTTFKISQVHKTKMSKQNTGHCKSKNEQSKAPLRTLAGRTFRSSPLSRICSISQLWMTLLFKYNPNSYKFVGLFYNYVSLRLYSIQIRNLN